MKAVTFDLWGTLFSDDYGRNASVAKRRKVLVQTILTGHGFHFPYEKIEDAFSSFAQEIGMIRDRGLDLDAAEQTMLLLSQLEVNSSQNLIDEIEKNLSSIWLSTLPPLAPHTEEVLSFLSPKVKIGLISNTGWTSGEKVSMIFEKLGILHYFDFLTFSNEVKLWKPNPQIFLHTTKALGVRPREAMHVGDSLKADIRGAKGIGMKAAYLGRSEEADFCLETLGDIISVWEKVA